MKILISFVEHGDSVLLVAIEGVEDIRVRLGFIQT
jgi:hypothetical protein